MALHIEVNAAQRYQVVTTENGIKTTPIGPAWLTPRQASDYLRTLSEVPDVPATRPGQPQTHVAQGDGAAPIGWPDPAAPPVDVTGDSLGFGF